MQGLCLAHDLSLSITANIQRVVEVLIRQGDLERVEVSPEYTPHLCLTRHGLNYLKEREPNWWKGRTTL